jgi:diacylglycerol kinase (ATP)
MRALIDALLNSLRGFAFAIRSERAVRQEFVVLAVALPAALLLSDALWERVALVGSILVVLSAELLNTGLEKLCDVVRPESHPAIRAVKDMGSAAVLCTIILAALIWAAALVERLQP